MFLNISLCQMDQIKTYINFKVWILIQNKVLRMTPDKFPRFEGSEKEKGRWGVGNNLNVGMILKLLLEEECRCQSWIA